MLSHNPHRQPMSPKSLNKSKSVPAPRAKVLVPKSAMDVTAESTRPCTCCKMPISVAQPYVWCEPCRLKERERSRRKAEAKRAGVSTSQAKRMGEAEKGDASSINPPAGVKRAFAIAEMKSKAKADLLAESPGMHLSASIKDSTGNTSARLKRESGALQVKKARTVSTGTKRGFSLLEESTGDTSAKLKREFTSVQKKKAKISHPVLAGTKRPLASLEPNSDEYQTSKMLYDSLVSCVAAATSAGSPLQFDGCYTIVSTGIPAVAVQRRAEIAARELRDRLKACQHHAFDQSAPVLRDDSVLSSALIFRCLCFASSSPNMPPEQDNKTGIARFLKGSESHSASAGPAAGASSCNGQISITVEDDFSHPMGIKGHKISIHMEH